MRYHNSQASSGDDAEGLGLSTHSSARTEKSGVKLDRLLLNDRNAAISSDGC